MPHQVTVLKHALNASKSSCSQERSITYCVYLCILVYDSVYIWLIIYNNIYVDVSSDISNCTCDIQPPKLHKTDGNPKPRTDLEPLSIFELQVGSRLNHCSVQTRRQSTIGSIMFDYCHAAALLKMNKHETTWNLAIHWTWLYYTQWGVGI